MINWRCFLNGHSWLKVDEIGDWLDGGTYFYICRRCLKKMQASPLRGFI